MKQGDSPRKAGKGYTDLWAGVAAALVFLGSASLLGIGWFTVCALLGLGVYVGVRLMLPVPQTPEAPEIPPVPLETLVEEIRGMARRLPPPLAAQLGQIGNQAAALQSYFQAHPERADPGLFLTRQHLQMTHTLTSRWLETARTTSHTAPQSAQKLDAFLTDVSNRLSQLHHGLTQADDAHLAGEIEALTRTMKEMDEVYQRIGGGSR